MPWHVCAAAAIGRSHVDGGLPCQDAFARTCEGEVLIAVVCDGAGSQPRSHEGAQALSAEVVAFVAARVRDGAIAPSASLDAMTVCARDAIASARAALAERATRDGAELAHFAATLVGVVADRDGGWFFHIGDGVGAALDEAGACTVSLPENGEYANETYFVTGDEWEAHLRVSPIAGPVASVLLMSDGAMPFAMTKDLAAPYRAFFDPVTRYLVSVDAGTGSQALLGTLSDPRTDTITSDDKTLLVALQRE
ncbi:protein phosphatase 2C domain-containing protein [Lysobacter sp. A6]|uniref:Protein phosphatase 2C domain-containing protein n=1 Tax=Noviluteimonas lactosilytica TaxID=2888523 RepID=A0ABS8JHL2_9GAMM|nr:PP2C family serine/threonine-protein phosphatase [Lysobacter lactosilyticus]MCC8363093.1 protein phosphatase 2C domain-containing protein [Lysobacter lactosilyticus]